MRNSQRSSTAMTMRGVGSGARRSRWARWQLAGLMTAGVVCFYTLPLELTLAERCEKLFLHQQFDHRKHCLRVSETLINNYLAVLRTNLLIALVGCNSCKINNTNRRLRKSNAVKRCSINTGDTEQFCSVVCAKILRSKSSFTHGSKQQPV